MMFFVWILFLMLEIVLGRPQGILFNNFVHNNAIKNVTVSNRANRGHIHFPEYIETSKSPFYVDSRINKVPKCTTNGLSFCEDVDSYPYNYLKKVLEKNKMLKLFFGKDEGSKDVVSERLGEDEKFICQSISRTIFPKVGQNKNDKWKFIINQGDEDGFVQGVRIEICKNMDGQCDFPGTVQIGSGYQTSCKQKYVYRSLVALGDNGVPVADTFKIPSACCCAYKQTFDFLTRLGAGGFSSTKKRK